MSDTRNSWLWNLEAIVVCFCFWVLGIGFCCCCCLLVCGVFFPPCITYAWPTSCFSYYDGYRTCCQYLTSNAHRISSLFWPQGFLWCPPKLAKHLSRSAEKLKSPGNSCQPVGLVVAAKMGQPLPSFGETNLRGAFCSFNGPPRKIHSPWCYPIQYFSLPFLSFLFLAHPSLLFFWVPNQLPIFRYLSQALPLGNTNQSSFNFLMVVSHI